MTINQYSQPIQNTLESYIPLPLDTLMKAGQAIQSRGDIAQNQNDQFQTGLSSMEALAPDHRQYVNKAVNNYKQQQSDLLDKYKGNTSDPDYERESRRLNMQFAADPNLKVIQNTNDLFKAKQKIRDTLDSQGVKYLDSNPNFTGTDDKGNLSNNVGQLRATAFDTNIDRSFKELEAAQKVKGNKLTNEDALHTEQNGYLSDLVTGANPDIQDALHYYKQQGMTDTQAKAAVIQGHINPGMRYLKESPNYQGEEMSLHKQELGLNWSKFNYQKQKDAEVLAEKAREADLKAKGKGVNGYGEISSTQSPILTNFLNKDKINSLENTLNNLKPNGGIKKGSFTVADTPENRTKYPKAIAVPETNGIAMDPAIGASSGTLEVPTDKYNPDELKLVTEAREILGDKAKNKAGGYLSDKTVLSQYHDILKNSQAESLSYAQPENDKYSQALTKEQFGSNGEKLGHNFIIVTDKGTFKSGSKEAQRILGGIKHISANGVNPAPVGDYTNGSIRGSANQIIKDGSGNETSTPVTIIKPMDENMSSQYRFANIGERAKSGSFSNDELKSSSQFRIPAKGGGYLVPQRGLTDNGRIGVHFVHINEKGTILNDLKGSDGKPIDGIPLDEVVNEAHSNYFSRLGASIDDKPEKQSYQDNEEN